MAWPIAMFFAVIMTGNHFVLDAVAGGIVSFAGLGIAFAIERARPRLRARLGNTSTMGHSPTAEPRT